MVLKSLEYHLGYTNTMKQQTNIINQDMTRDRLLRFIYNEIIVIYIYGDLGVQGGFDGDADGIQL